MNTFIDGAAPASGPLSHLGLMRFSGPDAASFLQGQISNDTRRLTAGAPLLAAYSTAQGRVVAVLHLLPHSSGVLAILPRDILLPTLEQLRKFVLRAKVQIEDLSGQFAVLGRHLGAEPAADGLPVPDTAQAYVERDGIGVARVGSDAHRHWCVGDARELADRGVKFDTESAPRIERDWRLADIRAGLPQIYAATREMFVAQMLNLDLLDGISFTKGCFTGQEIIARTQHLGRIKRRMVRLRLPAGTWAIGQAVKLTDGRSGRLTELAANGDTYESLAVLTLESGSEADSPASVLIDAVQMPLPYSLDPAGRQAAT